LSFENDEQTKQENFWVSGPVSPFPKFTTPFFAKDL